MNILFVSATPKESEFVQTYWPNHRCISTGAGILASAYYLLKEIHQNKPDFIVNIGIAGSFLEDLAIGTTVVVEKDALGDFGAQDDTQFLSSFDLGLEEKNNLLYQNGWIVNKNIPASIDFKKVSALTVHTVSGNTETIRQRKKDFTADIETMEGFALAYICTLEKIPYLQIRTISNAVEKRNRNAWNIPLALENLARDTKKIVSLLFEKHL